MPVLGAVFYQGSWWEAQEDEDVLVLIQVGKKNKRVGRQDALNEIGGVNEKQWLGKHAGRVRQRKKKKAVGNRGG